MDPNTPQTAGAPAQPNIAPTAPAAGMYATPIPGAPYAAFAGPYPTQPAAPVFPQQAPPLAPAAPLTPAPPAPTPVAVAADELARLYAVQKQFEEFQRNQADAARQAEAARLLAEAEKGKVQEAFREFQQKAQAETEQLRTAMKAGEVARVVAEAMAGVPFASDEARKDAMLILKAQVDAQIDPVTGSVIVRDLSGRPAVDALRELVAGARFAHYRAPSTQGGTAGQTFQGRAPVLPAEPAIQPGSHADIVNQVRAARGLPPLDPAAFQQGGPAIAPPNTPANGAPRWGAGWN